MVSIPAGSALGRYRVIEQLGRGGMATVFRCHDPQLDRHVAVKVLPSYYTEDPTFIQRFTQEAQTAARLSHPNILQIYDFGEDKGYTYIVTTLLPGGDLQDKLGGQPLSVEETLKYMEPLAEALDFAHGQGIVHRDLKPANIFLDAEDRPILADFGLARMLESSTRFTQASQALGTPEYMAPEQAMGADADHRSDLYAFGIMTYQMLLGETPYRADTPAATLMAHVHRPLPLPTALNPDIDPKLESTLLKALAKEPDDRFQSATEFTQSIRMAAGLATQAAAPDDLGATAVLDTGDLDLADIGDAATAVVGVGGEAAAEVDAEAPVASPKEAPPEPASPAAPPGGPNWVLIGGGAAAAVVVVAVVAILALSGGGDGDGGEGDGAAAAVSPASAESPGSGQQAAKAQPKPTISLAEAVAALDKIMSRAESNVVKLREVELDNEVVTELKTREDLAAIVKGFARRDLVRQRTFDAEELYKALGLLAEDDDLEDIVEGIRLQQLVALFDEESEKVYIVSDSTSIGALEELGVASAYMGGILQELFDISSLLKRAQGIDLDQYRAVNALVGGDVRQVQTGYVSTVFTRDQVQELQQPIAESKLLAAPDAVRKVLMFPAQEGATFVSELFGADGWNGVNAAYARPPVSSEQIIHPEKYFAQEEPQRTTLPDVSGSIGKGWTQTSASTMGEFLIRTYLEEYLDESQAEEAAAGWGGDHYSLISGPAGERLLISVIRWDSFDDSKQFFDAYKLFIGIKTQGLGAQSVSVGASGWRSVTADEAVFIGQQGPTIFLIIADDVETLGLAVQLTGQLLQPENP